MHMCVCGGCIDEYNRHTHTSLSCLSLLVRYMYIYIYIYIWVGSCDLYEYMVRRGIKTSSDKLVYEPPCVCVCVFRRRVFFSGPIFECHLEIESALSLQYEPYIHTYTEPVLVRIDIWDRWGSMKQTALFYKWNTVLSRESNIKCQHGTNHWNPRTDLLYIDLWVCSIRRHGGKFRFHGIECSIIGIIATTIIYQRRIEGSDPIFDTIEHGAIGNAAVGS